MTTGKMDDTQPREGVVRRGYVRTQLARALDVPDGDLAVGLCQLKCVGWSPGGRPVYDPVEAVTTMRAYYQRMYAENRAKYFDKRAEHHRDFALKYRARAEKCDALLEELERQGFV